MATVRYFETRGVTADINYQQQNNWVQSVDVFVPAGLSCFVSVTLTDGRTFSQTFLPGSTSLNFPNHVLQIAWSTTDPGDYSIPQIASMTTRVPA